MTTALDRKAIARERSKKWRESRIEKGLCYKHNVLPGRIPHCYVCRPNEPLRSPAVGEEIKVCLRCDRCGNIYHAGGRYNYHPLRLRKNYGIKEGPNGSLINYDKRKLEDECKAFSICGECRIEDGCDDWTKGKYRNFSGWSGICRIHAMRARMRKGDVPHPSGAVVHRSQRILEPGWRKRPVKVKFTCANRKPHPHQSETYLSQTEYADGKPRIEWRGLCSDCQSIFPIHNKITEDVVKGGVKLGFKEPDEQGRVLVTYLICKDTRWVSRERAASLNTDPPKIGICPECRRNPARLIERSTEPAVDERKDVNAEKKRPGPEKGFNAKITEEKIREAYKVLGRYVPQEKLAEEIGVDARSLREWHRERGLSYKQMRQQFTETGGR
jgi:hypothetical protein